MPAHRKSPALKMIDGSREKDRPPLPEAPASVADALDDVPPPPGWLPNAFAVDKWNELAPVLKRNGRLNEANLTMLSHVCAAHGKIIQGYQAGTFPTASMLGTLEKMMASIGLSNVVSPGTGTQNGEPAKPATGFGSLPKPGRKA